MIQCQEFEILFIPFISASILIYVRVYINYVQSYAIIRKIYPFCPFFFIFAAFLDKNRGRRRVFCHSKQLVFRPFAHRPLAQKVAQPLSRRPPKLAQICRRPHPSCPPLHPSSLPIVFNFSAPSFILSATSTALFAISSILPLLLFILSATAPILPATNYMLTSGHEIMIAKHDFLISCPETTVSCLAIILKRAAGAMALVSPQVIAYAGVMVITINRI